MFAVFLTSGLFLGWSLGANDAANVFGTAVGTRMISFKKAAIFCGIFVILGAVISGAGAAKTLGELGAVNAIAGAFVVALAAAVTPIIKLLVAVETFSGSFIAISIAGTFNTPLPMPSKPDTAPAMNISGKPYRAPRTLYATRRCSAVS